MLPFSLALILIALLTGYRGCCWRETRGSQPLHFDDIPSGKKIVKVSGCLWGVSTMGQVSVSWFEGPLTDDEIAQLIKMTKDNPGTADLKKANYKETTNDFPQASCSSYTPQPVPKIVTKNRDILLSFRAAHARLIRVKSIGL